MRRHERGCDEHAPASHTDRAIGKRRDAGKHKCLRSKNLSAAWDDSGATRRGRQAPSLAIRIQKSRRSRVARPSSGSDLLSRRGTPHCRTGDAPELRGSLDTRCGLHCNGLPKQSQTWLARIAMLVPVDLSWVSDQQPAQLASRAARSLRPYPDAADFQGVQSL
jgi:hypothetical protein